MAWSCWGGTRKLFGPWVVGMHLTHRDGRSWNRPRLGKSLALSAVHTSSMVPFFACTWTLTFSLSLSFQISNFLSYAYVHLCTIYLFIIYLYIIYLDILYKYFNILCYFYIYIFSYIIILYFCRCIVYKYFLSLGVCREKYLRAAEPHVQAGYFLAAWVV